jgi:hypothetical protein
LQVGCKNYFFTDRSNFERTPTRETGKIFALLRGKYGRSDLARGFDYIRGRRLKMQAVTVAFFLTFTAGSPLYLTIYYPKRKVHCTNIYRKEENKIKITPNCQSMMTKRKPESFSP